MTVQHDFVQMHRLVSTPTRYLGCLMLRPLIESPKAGQLVLGLAWRGERIVPDIEAQAPQGLASVQLALGFS